LIWPLQNLRFMAAVMVVYVHAAQTAFSVTGSHGLLPQEFHLTGRAGVDIFFVISGAIMSATAPGLTWGRFAWKRFRRIVPVYYLLTLPVLIIAWRTGAPLGWREVLATFLLWPATDTMTEPLSPVAWTLCFEALFYAAVALILADRRWLPALLVVFLVSLALAPWTPVFQFLGNPLIVEFMIGAALVRLPKWRTGKWGLPLGLVALAATGFLGLAPDGSNLDFLAGERGFHRLLVYGLPAAAIVHGALQYDGRKSFWTEQGDASYSLYLSHPLLVGLLWEFWKVFPARPEIIVFADIAICAVFAWRFHLRIEAPILKALDSTALKRASRSQAGIHERSNP
jgi:exopolysaccharide production protein ExoZ